MTLSLRSRERPYTEDNRASIARKATRPRNLLAWFVTGFRAELPERLHGRGVWADQKGRGDAEGYKAVGGSLIGTPRTADAFRQYLEEPPYTTEQARLTDAGVTVVDPAYRFPMRAALAAVAGRGRDSDPYPFMARTLFRVACMDGDWDAACRSMGIPEPIRWVYVQTALVHLWDRYRDEPPPRTIREDPAA